LLRVLRDSAQAGDRDDSDYGVEKLINFHSSGGCVETCPGVRSTVITLCAIVRIVVFEHRSGTP